MKNTSKLFRVFSSSSLLVHHHLNPGLHLIPLNQPSLRQRSSSSSLSYLVKFLPVGKSQYQRYRYHQAPSSSSTGGASAGGNSVKVKANNNSTNIKTQQQRLRYPKMIRGSLKVIKLPNLALLQQLLSPELLTLNELFKKYGYELRMAGGAVRDLILNKIPADVDFATTATPDQMKAMFETEGIRLINMNGEKHGTITPRINDKENFEITTLRIDVVTDGRHAEVEFTTDWEIDAGRRDLTINSMFLDLEGNISDYHNGLEDLTNRHVRFVGNPVDRIQEDYLRILRYFRFYGKIATTPDSHDPTILSAIQANMDGLKSISGERIWTELRKILSGAYVGPLITQMLGLGLGPYIGLPPQPNLKEFQLIVDRATALNLELNPMTYLSTLMMNETEVMELHKRLRLSAFERDLALFVVIHRGASDDEPPESTGGEKGDEHEKIPIRRYQKLQLFSSNKTDFVRAWIQEVLKYKGQLELLHEFEAWTPPKFPIDGFTLKELNVPPKLMSKVLFGLKEQWIDSNFSLTSEDLVPEIPKLLEGLQLQSPLKKSKQK